MEVREPNVVWSAAVVELHLDQLAYRNRVVFTSHKVRQNRPSLLQRHDDWHVGSDKSGSDRSPDSGPAVDLAAT